MGDMVQTWGLLWDRWEGSFTVNVMKGGDGSHTYFGCLNRLVCLIRIRQAW